MKDTKSCFCYGRLVASALLCLGGVALAGVPGAARAQDAAAAVEAEEGYVEPTATVDIEWQESLPSLTAERAARLESAVALVNRPRPAAPDDGVIGAPPLVPETPAGLPPEVMAPGDLFTVFRALTDAETANSTSVINEPSIAGNWPSVFYTANWFAARSTDGAGSFTYVDPDLVLPPIAGQFFCCDQSILYDRSRQMFIWIVLWIDAGANTGTVRVAISEDMISWSVYDFSSASFGLAGLPDYPHVALGANSLYMTINHFNPFFTQTTWARFPLTELKRRAPVTYSYLNRNEFNLKAAHDYGPGTKGYAATHVDNDTIRVFRWQEGSGTIFISDINIPAWTRGSRGQFVCVTPDGNDPCQRMDDRMMSGIVTGPKKLPVGAGAQKVVSFSWTARQGGAFPMPYTNVVRIDAEAMTLIDNPVMWNSSVAFFYADFEPNDRGDWGGILDMAGATTHPTVVAASLREESSVPPPWGVVAIRSGNDSPNSDTWGDYNTVRRIFPFGYLFLGAGHTLQGGGFNGDAESHVNVFGREGDLF